MIQQNFSFLNNSTNVLIEFTNGEKLQKSIKPAET